MQSSLTPRQQEILDLIAKSKDRLTIREICDKVAASNPVGIQHDLETLCRCGLITPDRRVKRKPR